MGADATTELVDDGRGGLVEAGADTEKAKQLPPGGGPGGNGGGGAGVPPGMERMTDEEKAFASKLDAEKREAFAKMPPDKRREMMKMPGGDGKKPPFGGDKKPPFGKGDDAKKAVSDAVANLTAIVDAIKASGAEMDDETKAQFEAATKALDAFNAGNADASNDEPGSNDAADVLKSAGADADTLAALNSLLGRKGESIEKAGARMAKARLERFRKAMEILQGLLKDFSPAETEVSKSLLGQNLGALDLAFVQKFASRANADPELVGKIEKLTDLVAAQNKRIDEIKKAAGSSNVIPFERRGVDTVEESPWPLDMNRPLTRENVSKDVSFFDVE